MSLKKLRKLSNQSGENNDETESFNNQEEILATFVGKNPEGSDFHGIKQLLNQLFLKAHINLSEISEILINQVGLGSVLKQGYDDEISDDEDDMDLEDESYVFGITSVINLTGRRSTSCVQQFYDVLKELTQQHADNNIQENVTRILESEKLGFLINERFVNIPAKISIHMLNSLLDELERKKKKDSSYNFDYFVLICKTSKSKGSKSDELYSNDEEEIFAKAADFSFDFSVEKECDSTVSGKWLAEDKPMIPYRRIVFFKASKLESIVNEIKVLLQ